MNSKKLYYLLIGGLVAIGLLIVGTAYGANSLLISQSTKLADIKAQSQALSDRQLQLTKNKQDVKAFSELNTIAQTIVPQDKDQAEAVRQIVSLATQSGIAQLSSVTFPASTLGVVGPALKTSAGITQVTPVIGISGVYDLPITVSQDTNHRVLYSQFTTFLAKLEQNRRTAQVSSITIQPDVDHPDQISFTLTLDEFIKP